MDRRLIYFDGLGLYLRYDRIMDKYELAEDIVGGLSFYDYWFTIEEVGSVLYYDFGTDGDVIK